jgi:flagellar hook protein FlgE
MSLYGLLTTSASGMAAQSTLLGTVADNIANVGTTGYKNSSADFSTMVLSTSTANYQSGSVLASARTSVDAQGGLTSTNSPTDLAVEGNGFFIVQNSGGEPLLTRAGSFVVNAAGNLVNAAGYALLGYPVGTSGAANGYNGLVPVNLSTLGLKASPTTSGQLYLNLPANSTAIDLTSTPPQSPPSANTAGDYYNKKTSLVGYDNLGNAVTMDVYLTNMGPDASGNPTWEVDVYNAANADTTSTGPFPYGVTSGGTFTPDTALVTGTLTFDPTNGKLTSGSPLTLTVPNGQSMSLDMSQSTQLAAAYTILQASTNGNAPSQVSKVQIATDGTLSTVYQNGATVEQYNIPLATVISPDNMSLVTGNAFLPNTNSGAAQIGKAGLGGVGTIKSNTLENSTVDLASELTSMIAAQNNYQANSKVFQTGTQLLQVLIGLER